MPSTAPALPAAQGRARSGEKLPWEKAGQPWPLGLRWLLPALFKLTRPFLISRRIATLPWDQARSRALQEAQNAFRHF